MKIRFLKIVYFVCVIIILNCNTTAISETGRQSIVNKESIQQYDERKGAFMGAFIIKFTNLIYEVNGKNVKIPIFRGNMGDATYKEFHEYCYKNNLLKARGYIESGFIVESEKGKLTNTFHEFLNFYKNNILKDCDIKTPTYFRVSGNLQHEPVLNYTWRLFQSLYKPPQPLPSLMDI